MICRMLFAAVSFCVSSSCLAQDTLYFRGFKGSEFLTFGTHKITLQLADTSQSPEVLAANYPELDMTTGLIRMGPHVFVVTVRDTGDVASLVERLNQDERVEFAIRVAYSRGGSELFLNDQISIILYSSSDRQATEAAISNLDLAVIQARPNHAEDVIVVMRKSQLSNYRQILDTIARIRAIRCVSPVFWSKLSLLSAPNDPYWSEQQQLWADKINLEHAYEFVLRPDSVSIHFFDDGVENHEDFPQPYSIVGYNWVENHPPFTMGPYSRHGMGTTGVTYAKINNALGISGYNSANFKVRVQQIFITGTDSTDQHFATNLNIFYAMTDAAENGADIINHSWGFNECDYDDPDGYIAYGLDSVYKLGVLSVAGAGNCKDELNGCACVILPARDDHVLAVGGLNFGTNNRDLEASYGPELDVTTYSRDVPTLSRMGAHVKGTVDELLVPNCNVLPVNYRCMTGTSISSPQAAAIAGLVLAKRPDFKNKPDTLAMILRYSTDDGATPCTLDTARHNDEIGYGRLDAYRALHSVSRGNVNNVGIIDLSDLSYLVLYVTGGGPAPLPDRYIGDVTCDCEVNIADISLMVAFLSGQPVVIPLCFKFPSGI